MKSLSMFILSTLVCQVVGADTKSGGGINLVTESPCTQFLRDLNEVRKAAYEKCSQSGLDKVDDCTNLETKISECRTQLTRSVVDPVDLFLNNTFNFSSNYSNEVNQSLIPHYCSGLTSDKFETRLKELKSNIKDNKKDLHEAQKDLSREMKELSDSKSDLEEKLADLPAKLAEKLEDIETNSLENMDKLQEALNKAEDSIQEAALQKISLQQEELKATAEFAAKVQVQTDKIISLTCEMQAKKLIKDLLPKKTGSMGGSMAANQKTLDAVKEQYRTCWESGIKQRDTAYKQYQTALNGIKERQTAVDANVERAKKFIADLDQRKIELTQKTQQKKVQAEAQMIEKSNLIQKKLNELNNHMNQVQYTNTMRIMGLQQDAISNANDMGVLMQKEPPEGTKVAPREVISAFQNYNELNNNLAKVCPPEAADWTKTNGKK